MLFLCNIAKLLKEHLRSLNRDHANIIINYIDKNVKRMRKSPDTSTCEVPRDVSRKLQVTLCAIMAS